VIIIPSTAMVSSAVFIGRSPVDPARQPVPRAAFPSMNRRRGGGSSGATAVTVKRVVAQTKVRETPLLARVTAVSE
jgi:hypothetical protein